MVVLFDVRMPPNVCTCLGGIFLNVRGGGRVVFCLCFSVFVVVAGYCY